MVGLVAPWRGGPLGPGGNERGDGAAWGVAGVVKFLAAAGPVGGALRAAGPLGGDLTGVEAVSTVVTGCCCFGVGWLARAGCED